MAERKRQQVEFNKTAAYELRSWFVGVLEIGGSVSYPPHIQFTDRNFEGMQNVFGMVGGEINPLKNGSATWSVNSKEALSLGEIIYDFVPGRRNELNRCLNREDTIDDEAKTNQYLELLGNSSFVAGIIDIRGNFTTQHYGRQPKLQIRSKNKLLLTCIQIKFGGSITELISNGVLTLSGESIRHILNIAYEKMIVNQAKVNEWNEKGWV